MCMHVTLCCESKKASKIKIKLQIDASNRLVKQNKIWAWVCSMQICVTLVCKYLLFNKRKRYGFVCLQNTINLIIINTATKTTKTTTTSIIVVKYVCEASRKWTYTQIRIVCWVLLLSNKLRANIHLNTCYGNNDDRFLLKNGCSKLKFVCDFHNVLVQSFSIHCPDSNTQF